MIIWPAYMLQVFPIITMMKVQEGRCFMCRRGPHTVPPTIYVTWTASEYHDETSLERIELRCTVEPASLATVIHEQEGWVKQRLVLKFRLNEAVWPSPPAGDPVAPFHANLNQTDRG